MIFRNRTSKLLLPATIFLGFLAGIISSSGSILIAGVFVGVVLGGCLTLSLRLLFYVAIFFCMVVCGLLEFYFFIGQANWLASGLCLILLIISCMNLLVGQPRIKANDSIYPIVVLFLSGVVIGGAFNLLTPLQWVVGLRTYLPFIGVLLALTVYLRENDLERIPLVLLCIGMLQLPFCMHQFFVIGPIRNRSLASIGGSQEAMVGTFGGDMFGGGYTAEMALFMLIAACIAVAINGKGRFYKAIKYFMPLSALLCVALAETKIVILITPIVFLIIFWEELRASPKFLFGAFTVIALAVTILISVYALRFYESGDDALHAFTYSFDPNFMVDQYHRGRIAALIHWWDNVFLSGDLMRILFGYGVASTLEASRVLGEGNAVKVFGLGLDAHASSKLLWDTGICGLVLFIWLLVRSAKNANTALQNTSNPNVVAMLKVSRGAMFIFAAMLPYQIAMFGGPPMQFLFWLFIGYIECSIRLFPALKEPHV